MSKRPWSDYPPALAGAALGALFGGLAAVRHGKPLHPTGVVYDALVRRFGAGAAGWGAAWLDEPGEDRGVARLSAAAGLPRPLPDVGGLALTFTDDDGIRRDLLLATTGLAVGARFVLKPTRRPGTSPYGSLLPYRGGRGLILLAAVPAPLTGPASLSFHLLAASPAGRWRKFGELELTRRVGKAADEPLRFDPVRYLLPGLRWPRAVALLREPAYAAARRAHNCVGK